MSQLLFSIILIAGLTGCASRSIMPDSKEVTVSRNAPNDSNCHEMGNITGTSTSVNGTREQALEDLKREAANKGANYVVVKQYSDLGTAVTGLAYGCKQSGLEILFFGWRNHDTAVSTYLIPRLARFYGTDSKGLSIPYL